MKLKIIMFGSVLAVFALAGCAQHQRGESHSTVFVTSKAGSGALTGYGPSYTTFEENGKQWVRGSMAFPTGIRESSGLLVEKTVPAEVLMGQKFDYSYKVSNLTDHTLEMVTVTERVSPNFSPGEAEPPPTEMNAGIATWKLGSLGPRESKIIHVKGTGTEEGAVTSCTWASHNPTLCEDIKVVRADVQLTKTSPAEVVLCDTIPMALVVKNTGSSSLTEVKVTDVLPQGLTSDGQNSVSFDVGKLAPGESKELGFKVVAAARGSYDTAASVTSAEGAKAEAKSTTIVHEPELTITGTVPAQRYMGRPFDVCYTVVNKGDAIADGTIVEMPVPPGLTFKSATAGGIVSGDNMKWDLGSLGVNEQKEVCSTFVSPGGGIHVFNAAAKGTCAKSVSATCQISVLGVTGLLLENWDDTDPISVGETTTYTVKITNQGTAEDTNVKMVVEFPDELTPLSASAEGKIEGKRVIFPAYPKLTPKQVVSYTIRTRGDKAGDARVRFIRTSDGIPNPTTSEESTRIY